MNRKILWIIMVGLLASGTMLKAAVPVVTNVVAQQQVVTNFVEDPPGVTNAIVTTNKLVDIYYDLFDDDTNDIIKVRIEISDNGGTLYSVPAFSFTGDIGDGVVTGVQKHVVWDAGVDWDGEYSDKMRVKVIAVDANGFPGLEWAVEIPASGFLLGQDGGPEESGPSRHVNVPWSYWLSKYEIRNDQYLDFINSALVAGYVYREGVDSVKAHGSKFSGVPEGSLLINIGDDKAIRWNVNNFEIPFYPTNTVPSVTNFPVEVSWYGAMAFARYYGYDLPTEAEWEKAARGLLHDDEDQHQVYPWGDEIGKGDANFADSDDPYGGTTPVGYYDGNQTPSGDDMISAYGMYDIAGNVSEWCRTKFISSVEDYQQEESLDSDDNDISVTANRVYRGGWYGSGPEGLACYKRKQANSSSIGAGFRVARRTIENDDPTDPGGGIDPDAEIGENFDGVEWAENTNGNWTVYAASGEWVGNSEYTYIHLDATNSRSLPGYIQLSQPPYAVAGHLEFPATTNLTTGIDVWARRMNSTEDGLLKMQVWNGIAWYESGSQSLTFDEYTKVHFDVISEYTNTVEQVRLSGTHGVYIDDANVFSIPRD